MTSRIILLVAAALCAALTQVRPAAAQTELPLRPSYQGEFLPEGTSIVVLAREGRVQRDGRFQPEFFSIRDFPRNGHRVLRRDRLNDTGRSTHGYTGSQDSGRLYFIYALTPDSTLYWSYSARRDSLKFDVVSTGVMSVAPLPAREIRDEVLRSFFRPRVTVVMRGDDNSAPGSRIDPAAGLMEADTDEALSDDVALVESEEDSTILIADVSPAVEAATATVDTAAAGVLPVASATTPLHADSSGVTLPPLLAWSLFFLLLAVLAVPVYLVRTLRAERRAAMEDAWLRYEQLEEDYEILEARYAALERELDTAKALSAD